MLSALLALTAAAQDDLHTTRYYVDRIREFARNNAWGEARHEHDEALSS